MVATDYYGKYLELHDKTKGACATIDGKPCSVVARELSNIVSEINGLHIMETWQGDLSGSYQNAIESCTNALNSIANSISSTWASGEATYKQLLEDLNKLQIKDKEYKEKVKKEPKVSDKKYIETYKEPGDEPGKFIFRQYHNIGLFRIDHSRWEAEVNESIRECEDLTMAIEWKKSKLLGMSFGSAGFSAYYASSNGEFSRNLRAVNTDVSTLLKNINYLPVDTQKDYFINELGWTGSNPFEDRYTQSYPNIYFAGGPLNITGCAGATMAQNIACLLTHGYKTNIECKPDRFLPFLYKDNGTSSSSYGSGKFNWGDNFFIDVTNSVRNVTFVKLKTNYNGVVSYDNIKDVTDAGGTLYISVRGENHFYLATETKGNNVVVGKDVGFVGNEEVVFGEPLNYKNGQKGGDVSGKAAWLGFYNGDCKTSGDTFSVNNVDFSKFGEVESIFTSGKKFDATKNSDGSLEVKGLAKSFGVNI